MYCWSGARSLEKEGVSAQENGSVDYRLLKSVVVSCRVIYSAIAIVALIVLSTVGTLYVLSVSAELDHKAVVCSWIVFGLGVFLNLLFSYCESLVRGVGDVFGVSIAIIASSILQLATAVTMLVLGFGLLGASFGFLAQGLAFRVLCMSRFSHYCNLGAILKLISVDAADVRSVVTAVSHNALKDTLVSVASYLATSANTLICSLFFSLTTTGSYSVTMQIINAIAMFAGAIATAYQPSLQSAFSNKNNSLTRKICGKVLVAYHVIFCLSVCGMIFVVIPLVTYIEPSFAFDPLLVFEMTLYYYLWKHHSVCASLISNSNTIPYTLSFIISSCLGVCLSVLFGGALGFGATGLMFGQIASQIVYNNWRWPYALAKMLGTTYVGLLKSGLSRNGSERA